MERMLQKAKERIGRRSAKLGRVQIVEERKVRKTAFSEEAYVRMYAYCEGAHDVMERKVHRSA